MRAREAGLACGTMPPGARDTITDVPGVAVGHETVRRGAALTGVTAVLAHQGDLYNDKPLAAVDVLNGFGKSVGLVQVAELGTIETPILLSNTFAVGTCANALIRRALRTHRTIGRAPGTVNPVVFECSDAFLSDIRTMAVTKADAEAAIEAAGETFEVGAVGAGTGMSAFGLKGGIGSASRRVELDGAVFHVGLLVLANFGRAGDLLLPDGRRIDPETPPVVESGSCIVIVATDVPLSSRQLRRVARRAGAGLARCGSVFSNGSGDIVLAFTTANRVPHEAASDLLPIRVLAEPRLDVLFRATVEAAQEAVLDALVAAPGMSGRDGHRRRGLREFL